MMLRHGRRRAGFSLLEYLVLFMVLMGALMIFRVYLQRAMQGQYRKAGESYAMLRQYDPGASIDCAFDPDINDPLTSVNGIWYSQECLNNKRLSTPAWPGNDFSTAAAAYRVECCTFKKVAGVEGCFPDGEYDKDSAYLFNALLAMGYITQQGCIVRPLNTMLTDLGMTLAGRWGKSYCSVNSSLVNALTDKQPLGCGTDFWAKRQCQAGCNK